MARILNVGEYLDHSQRGGIFTDKVAKSFVTAMYSNWEELYRHKIADEAGVSQKAIKSDLMGDLRIMRHCIVHNKSVITDEHENLRELAGVYLPVSSASPTKCLLS